jgi:hypothetical protein
VTFLGRLWAGKAYGTNIGNLFLKLEGEDSALVGTLRINEPGVGLYAYSIAGSFDGSRLTLAGEPQTQLEGVIFGRLQVTATLSPRGELEGEWETAIGSAGTFILFPHDRSQVPGLGEETADQLHTARHHFGAIEIDREQIIALAENIQREFTKGRVIVTVVAGSEQSRYLEDFEKLSFDADRAEIMKIFVQEAEGGRGINKVLSVEFGPHVNWVMTQGPNESWVLGRLEKLKRDLKRFERTYATNVKRLGFGINQLLFVGAIIYLPSLANLSDRAFLMLGIIALILAVDWLHRKYLPFAAIYLSKKPEGLLARVTPSIVSWLIAATAGIVATLLAGYLQGWLALPSIP